jgi:GntR family transcriptional regulator
MANPMYRQIAEDLRMQIEDGDLEPGQQLRTEIELREHYSASRNTVRDAIKWLTNLGLVETKPGQGTFVVQKIDPFVTTLTSERGAEGAGPGEGASYLSEVSAQNRKPSTSAIQVEIQQASGEIAVRLKVSPGTEVISRHERRYIDRVPYSLQTSFYPSKFADDGAEKLRSAGGLEQGAVQYLKDTLGIKQVGYRDWITVRTPNSIESEFFKVPMDGRIVMYEIFRTAFDGNGNPMRVTVTVLPADRNQFVVNVGDVPQLLRGTWRTTSQLTHIGHRGPAGIRCPDGGFHITRTTCEPTQPGRRWGHGPDRARRRAKRCRQPGYARREHARPPLRGPACPHFSATGACRAWNDRRSRPEELELASARSSQVPLVFHRQRNI